MNNVYILIGFSGIVLSLGILLLANTGDEAPVELPKMPDFKKIYRNQLFLIGFLALSIYLLIYGIKGNN